MVIANHRQLICPVDYQKLVFIASFRVGLKQTFFTLRPNISGFKIYFLGRVKGSNLGSKFTRSQISPFKVSDIFRLFQYPLCHSNNQEINRKQKILLQFLPSGNVIINISVVYMHARFTLQKCVGVTSRSSSKPPRSTSRFRLWV